MPIGPDDVWTELDKLRRLDSRFVPTCIYMGYNTYMQFLADLRAPLPHDTKFKEDTDAVGQFEDMLIYEVNAAHHFQLGGFVERK